MKTVAILLAAGDSRRMGTPKALLAWQGRLLLEHQVDILCRSGVAGCIVVLGRDADRLAPLVTAPPGAEGRVRIVRNPRPEEGRASSVRAGLEALAAPAGALLFASVDQPLTLALVEALLAEGATLWRDVAIDAGPGTAATPPAILIPSFEGRRGHPILVHGALFPELLAIDEATQGLRGVIHRRPERVRDFPWTSAEILIDLNTPEDAARAGATPAPGVDSGSSGS